MGALMQRSAHHVEDQLHWSLAIAGFHKWSNDTMLCAKPKYLDRHLTMKLTAYADQKIWPNELSVQLSFWEIRGFGPCRLNPG